MQKDLKPSSARQNRFINDSANVMVRSLSESMTRDQRKQYKHLQVKNLRRERSVLSHTRYNKMKNIIIREFDQAIPEAEYEPSATVFETNMQASIMLQNQQDFLNVGSELYPKLNKNEMAYSICERRGSLKETTASLLYRVNAKMSKLDQKFPENNESNESDGLPCNQDYNYPQSIDGSNTSESKNKMQRMV